MTEHTDTELALEPSGQAPSKNPRLAAIVNDVADSLRQALARNDVNHMEFMMALKWMTQLQPREFMGLNMLFLESSLTRRLNENSQGTARAVEGPYHNEDAVRLTAPFVMPKRSGEPGTPMLARIKVTDTEGKPLSGVELDIWQASADGSYSGFTGQAPTGNLRALLTSDDNGDATFATIRPAPYLAMHEGLIYNFLYAIGSHAWRPAHIHFKVSKEGFKPLTTQLYFSDDAVLHKFGDPCDGVEESLIVDVADGSDPQMSQTYGLGPSYKVIDYTFVLEPGSNAPKG